MPASNTLIAFVGTMMHACQRRCAVLLPSVLSRDQPHSVSLLSIHNMHVLLHQSMFAATK